MTSLATLLLEMLPIRYMEREGKVLGKKGTWMITRELNKLTNEHGFTGKARRRVKFINDIKKKTSLKNAPKRLAVIRATIMAQFQEHF